MNPETEYGHRHIGLFYKPFLKVREDGFIFKDHDYSWQDIKKIIVMPPNTKIKKVRVASIFLHDGRRIHLNSRVLDKNGQKTKIGFLSFTNDVFEELLELFQQKLLRSLEKNPPLNVLTANQLDKEFRTIWGIWWIQFLSPVASALTCHVLNATWEPILSADFPTNILKFILYIICVLFLVLSNYVRNRILTSRIKESDRKNASLTGTNPAINKYVQALIWSLAICANMSLLGLGMFLLTKDFQSLYIVIVISSTAIIYYRPNRQALEGFVSAMNSNQDFPNYSLENRRA
jgi:hypothetical protein